jgi:hypothetical protein
MPSHAPDVAPAAIAPPDPPLESDYLTLRPIGPADWEALNGDDYLRGSSVERLKLRTRFYAAGWRDGGYAIFLANGKHDRALLGFFGIWLDLSSFITEAAGIGDRATVLARRRIRSSPQPGARPAIWGHVSEAGCRDPLVDRFMPDLFLLLYGWGRDELGLEGLRVAIPCGDRDAVRWARSSGLAYTVGEL